VLKWARQHGCPWDKSTCRVAASEGHLEVLRWAREHDCPWDETRMCEIAAAGGHLEVMEWARAQGCPWGVTLRSLAYGEHMHLDALKWAFQQDCPWDWDVVRSNAHYKHPAVYQWARKHDDSDTAWAYYAHSDSDSD